MSIILSVDQDHSYSTLDTGSPCAANVIAGSTTTQMRLERLVYSTRLDGDMHVEPQQGEPLRWLVSSESESEQAYLVDLAEYGFNGQCGCQHFAYRLKRKLDQGERGPHLECKHIAPARRAFMEMFGPVWAAELDGTF